MEASDFLEKAKKRYKACVDSWSEVYRLAKEDLDFLSDREGCQWDDREFADRTKVGRPAIQVDQLTQFCHQVVNDIRMNTPNINIIPADMEADPETAEMIEGRIKAIEYKSLADSAYDTAVDFSVKSSVGFIRVDRKYIDDESFEQELCIKRVVNPLSYYIDHNSVEPDGSDAKFAFVLEEMSLDEFKERWPDATPISFDKDADEKTNSEEEYITIAEYFEVSETEEYIGLLPDGTKERVDGRKKYSNKRNVKKRTVKHYKLAGQDILEETIFPGKYIPIVPVYGEEAWKDGKRNIYSLIRKSKGAQRMYNLWKSLETELLMKQPQAPVMAAEGQMAGYEDDWSQPDKAMVLYYKQTDINGKDAPAPQRLQPPTIPTGIVNAARETVDDIKATLGMYNASIGQRSNETSGRAIEARKAEGDVATYHFGDNLVKSVTQVGKILVSALPEIEDSQRIVSVVDKEENFKLIGINGAMTDKQERPYYMKGKFDVRVVTGAPFTTQRQEAAALYNQTIQAMPDLMPVIGDLVFKYQDAPGSQAISARLKKLVDPKLLDEKDQEAQNTQVQQMQQQMQQVLEQAQTQIQQLQAELQSKQADYQIKAAELEIKKKEAEIKAAEVAIKAQELQKPEAVDVHEQSIKEREMQLKEAEFQLKLIQEDKSKTEGESMAMQDSIEELQARLQAAIAKKQQEEINAQLLAQEEQRKKAEEMQEQQEKRAQSEALLQSLASISQQLANLTATVSQPLQVKDESGKIIYEAV